MKIIFLIVFPLLGCFMVSTALGQKPAVDTTTYSQWQSLDWGTKMSLDGNYVIYGIKNKPLGSTTMVIKSLTDSWETINTGISASTAVFTDDSRFAVYMNNHKMGVLNLRTRQTRDIDIIGSFSLNGQWLSYTKKDSMLVIENLATAKAYKWPHIIGYVFDEDNKHVAAQNEVAELLLVDLISGKESIISKGVSYSQIIFNDEGDQLALVKRKDTKSKREIWRYDLRDGKLTSIYSMSDLDSLEVTNVKYFTKDGEGLILDLRKSATQQTPLANPVPLNVWSYTDGKLQSQQLKELGNSQPYIAFLSFKTHDLRVLNVENSEVEFRNHPMMGELALLSKIQQDSDPGESNWNINAKRVWSVKVLESGKMIKLYTLDRYPGGSVKFSPDGRFLVYYDVKKREFFSYETATGKSRLITQGIQTSWHETSRDDLPNGMNQTRGVASWLNSSHEILLYDEYDIWKIDLLAEQAPVCLTRGIGAKNHIRFDIEETDENVPLTKENDMVLSGFDTSNKENGFYLAKIDGSEMPEKCFIGPYLFDLAQNSYLPGNAHFSPIQSPKRFLVRRMSEKESPNLFVTSDFKKFKAITNINTEKSYNWLTTDLLSWKSLDGRLLQGILYKPENFDPNKKYPVVFHYYERKSDGLHYFIPPENLTGGCTINIPTYVSNGYLVFSPDIYYKVGDPMQGTYDAVVSAAKYIAKLPFVDSTKMGIQGCSWGGVQTDYLVTHTNLFSAACSASGVSDFVSTLGGIGQDGKSLRSIYETGQSRMKYSLWERPDLYIKNSAIFSVDKVTTPLLLMHTTKDGVCPFGDALEFFTGLRRMGKKAWLLEYEDGNHGVWGKSEVDFSIRMRQFFDHYLKSKPAPIWMTRGLPASKKGMETGLELDTEIKTPGPGLLDTTLNNPPKGN